MLSVDSAFLNLTVGVFNSQLPLWISIGCTLKEEQPLRIVELITRTALYSVSKET